MTRRGSFLYNVSVLLLTIAFIATSIAAYVFANPPEEGGFNFGIAFIYAGAILLGMCGIVVALIAFVISKRPPRE